MNTIFPNSCGDVDWHIVLCLKDNEGLVALSGVNRRAYELLSNDHFAGLFERQHPQLIKCGLEFRVLPHYHPSNCWKVACCCFSKGVFKVNKPFLEMAIPLLCDSLKNKKVGLGIQLKGICGDFYEDPESPIHKAWNSWQFCKQKKGEKRLEREWLLEALKPFYSEEELGRVFRLCKDRGDDFMASEEGSLVGDFSVGELEVINPARIPHYQKIVKSMRAFDSLSEETFQLWGDYDSLEKKRFTCENELGIVEEELNSLVPGEVFGLGLQNHARRLEREFERLWLAEKALPNPPILQQCLELCVEASAQQPISEDLKNRIRDLINSCSHEVKTSIWSQLYLRCANSVEEPQWSEKHFHEFERALKSIVAHRLHHEIRSIRNAKEAQLKSLQL